MDLKQIKEDKKNELISRVEKCRAKLINLGIKKVLDCFVRKYPEYQNEPHKTNHLFYGNSTDEEFTQKLEAFTNYKQQEKQ